MQLLIFLFSFVTLLESVAQADAEPWPDLDAEVRDVKLRANSGAKSKYSMSLYFNYAGASLLSPGSDKRPNVGNLPIADPVSLSGNVGLRYRRNKNQSFFAATGFYRERPFHPREGNEKWEVNTPSFGLNDTLAVQDWEVSSNYRLYITTLDYRRDVGEVATFGYSLSTLNPIGVSRFSAGLNLTAMISAFDKNREVLRRQQNDYGFSFTPTLQFNISDRWNAYTSLVLVTYSHFRSDPSFFFHRGVTSQFVGLGVAIARDFYLSPYLSFEPGNISSRQTAVNLDLTLNL